MSINLNDFTNMFYTDTSDDGAANATVYVFFSEGDREKYREGIGISDFFSISSYFQMRELLKEKYATAKVLNFFSYDKNVIDVIVDLDE